MTGPSTRDRKEPSTCNVCRNNCRSVGASVRCARPSNWRLSASCSRRGADRTRNRRNSDSSTFRLHVCPCLSRNVDRAPEGMAKIARWSRDRRAGRLGIVVRASCTDRSIGTRWQQSSNICSVGAPLDGIRRRDRGNWLPRSSSIARTDTPLASRDRRCSRAPFMDRDDTSGAMTTAVPLDDLSLAGSIKAMRAAIEDQFRRARPTGVPF
jgi:hypothetical protein